MTDTQKNAAVEAARSDEVERHLAHPTRAQRPLHRVIYEALSEYRMSNMRYEDGDTGFPLVDLMSNDPPADIGTGQMEMVWLTDEIVEAIEASLPTTEQSLAGEVVGWIGSGSLMALQDGREGFIWPTPAGAHPIALYATPQPAPVTGGEDAVDQPSP